MTTVLVTGGSGLLGRALVERLLVAGHRVLVLSRRSPNAAGLPSGVDGVPSDLRRGSDRTVALAGVDTVVHCATDPRAPRESMCPAPATSLRLRGRPAGHI